MSPEIAEEWKRHQSLFARRWRVSMEARKKVYRINPAIDAQLSRKVVSHLSSDRQRDTIQKDYHLIAAALSTDHIVISLDDAVKLLFDNAASKVAELRDIIWINPDVPIDQLESWLSEGAQKGKTHLLGTPME